MLGGQVSVGINGLAEFAAQIEAGTLRVLAISSARAPARPRRADAARAGRRRRVRELALGRRAARASRPPSARGSSRRSSAMVRSRRVARAARALPLARSLSRRRRVRGVRGRRGTARARDPARARHGRRTGDDVRLARTRCSCCSRPRGARRRGAAVAIVRERTCRRDPPPPLGWRPLGARSASARRCTCCSPRRAGFIVAAALLFWFIARAFDARHPLRDAACALGRRGRELRRCSTTRCSCRCRPASSATGCDDAWSTLEGLRARLRERADARRTWSGRSLGTTLGTAIGVLPGIGPALTVAVLLPVTFSARSRSARSSCSAASTTARCTAARRRASC